MVRVHNITDRPNTPGTGRAFLVGSQKIRPGKFAEVDRATISKKIQQLHGTALWFGDLPDRFLQTSQSAIRVRETPVESRVFPMEYAEAHLYLQQVPPATLWTLCTAMSPELTFAKMPDQQVLVKRLARAIFTPGRILDPLSFFWLRRWARDGDLFTEKE